MFRNRRQSRIARTAVAGAAALLALGIAACSSSVLHRALAEIARLDFHVQAPLCLPIFE